jgi:SAM-dependent methyltransferase
MSRVRDYWNGEGGQKWAREVDRVDREIATITEQALAFAAPSEGERVLDVGCGCGTTCALLRDRVGARGRVVGIDISGPMLAMARSRTREVELIHEDAATYAFRRGSFDLVFSRLGVMFFEDPIAAFRNLRRALTATGRLAFVCPRAFREERWQLLPLEAAGDLAPAWPMPPGGRMGPYAFADPERVRAILVAAGYCDIVIERLDSVIHLGRTIDEAIDAVLDHGSLAPLVAGLADQAMTLRDRLRGAFLPFVQTGGVALPAASWLVGARKAGRGPRKRLRRTRSARSTTRSRTSRACSTAPTS